MPLQTGPITGSVTQAVAASLNLPPTPSGGRAAGGGPQYFAIAGTNTASAAAGVNANARLTVNPDGTWALTVSNGTGTPSPSGTQAYVSPIVGTPGDNLWIRATIVSGSFSNGPASGVITQMNAQINWNKGSTTGAFQVVFNVEIATDAAMANIVATGQVTIGYTHT